MGTVSGGHVFSGLVAGPTQSPTPNAAQRRSLLPRLGRHAAPAPRPAWRAISRAPPVTPSAGAEALPCPCRLCERRLLLLGASTALLPVLPSTSLASGLSSDPAATAERIHPQRPDWYEDIYAQAMEKGMRSYEAEVAAYKEKLFTQLTENVEKVLELGIGTGPNLKYYVGAGDRYVIGVDPNKQMEKYARASAVAAGLQSTNFSFIRGVGEALDVRDNTMDAVIGTLVLCSVSDVAETLREVRRVLKPGGLYLFIEHVAAQDGSLLRFMQGLVDPLQQFVADGCHLTRETGKQISEAGFSRVNLQAAFLSSLSIFGPHVYGIAYK
ncbi:ubiE/COQ5 methyltransferase family [Musa troglodytarum]|uniref:UbiE/COQ5 methyltransferase family n=1 Tax=Musa troglodytarum TaxID=320322 RepID=A0A9E7GCN6_9LILI|nr:ubiE/COQ5 methyltransferase family [Musa troglodytarum]